MFTVCEQAVSVCGIWGRRMWHTAARHGYSSAVVYNPSPAHSGLRCTAADIFVLLGDTAGGSFDRCYLYKPPARFSVAAAALRCPIQVKCPVFPTGQCFQVIFL